ncbi:MAG: hypothetical protein M1294_07465 [Firmicutes bacterium]|uniref:Uncharacterized protein n=1 Tax=Sulfobacillus benefaciens TaxID=453960 RepID=A0A2T2XB30_9FIRM|nr:hypothetical protein [Bacillota bacterium]MCL5015890.1 hypothetical protein [Bacillota bacterium]PSR31656.1 MAG: hypothetical protein C7B43_00060 [Sulfobacillus benefaciens]
MKRRIYYITGSALALLSLTGCGLNGTSAATSGHGANNSTVSGTVTATGHQSSSNNSQHKNAPNTSATPSDNYDTPPNASSSPSSGQGSTFSASSRAAAPFNPVILQAMSVIRRSTDLPLEAPEVVPLTAYSPADGYLTAITLTAPDYWLVQLRDTTVREPVNSRNISHTLSPTPAVGSFGINQLASNQVGTPSLDNTTLRQFNPLWHPNQSILNATGKERLVVGGPRSGLGATAYGFHGTFNNAKVMWAEGNWTIEVAGGSPRYEQDTAYHLVNYLHSHYLPPYPGLIMIQLTHEGRGNKTQAVTHMDWIDGQYLMHIDTRIPGLQNPVSAAKMAVSWSHY